MKQKRLQKKLNEWKQEIEKTRERYCEYAETEVTDYRLFHEGVTTALDSVLLMMNGYTSDLFM